MGKTRFSLLNTWLTYQVVGIGVILISVMAFQYVSVRQRLYSELETSGKNSIQALQSVLNAHPELFNEQDLAPIINRFVNRIPSIYQARAYDASFQLVATSTIDVPTPELALGELKRLIDQDTDAAVYYNHNDRAFFRLVQPLYGPYDPVHKSSVLGIMVIDMHLTNADHKVGEILREWILVFGSLFLLFLVVQYILMHTRLMKPLRQLTSTANRFGQQDFSARAPQRRDDELGLLATTFNHMADGLEKAHQGLVLEIEDRKQAEISLQQQTAILNSILMNIGEGVVFANTAGELLLFNPTAERILGADTLAVLPEDWTASYGVYYPDQVTPMPTATLPLMRAIQGEPSDRIELFVRNPTVPAGVLLAMSGRPILNEAGRIMGGVAVFHDITAQRHAQEARFYLASIVESSEDAILGLSLEGKVQSWNAGAERLYGYARQEMLGQSITCLMQADRQHEFIQTAEDILQGESVKDVETLHVHKAGTLIPIALMASPIRDDAERITGIAFISRNISLQKHTEAQLKQAKEAAEAADRAKSAFLANMSHEIRTPLNGVIGMTGLLINTELSTVQRHYAETIRQSADTLLAVISDILDFSKIEAGKMELEVTDFDLISVVEDVPNLLAAQALAKGLELASQIERDVPIQLRGDPFRLTQILINFVNNGIKFTQQGEVVVTVRRIRETDTTATLRFEIRDTGIGIDPEAQSRLFQPFSQVDTSTTRKYGGTGLGLAIATQIVALMDGTIGVESTPGQGSTFWMILTLEKQVLSSHPVSNLRTDLRGFRVLVVDDNPTNREIVHQQILSWEMGNGSAVSGPEALQKLHHALDKGTPYDVVLLDMSMPDMDGIEVAQAIKAQPLLAQTKIVLLTSLGQRGLTEELRNSGVAACLPKPIRQSELYNTLVTVMEDRYRPGPVRRALPIAPMTLIRTRAGTQPRILLVEDNVVNQRVTSAILDAQGYRADVVAHGREALQTLAHLTYDIVLMDCQMPEMDGYETTREIRKREDPHQHMPIVAMTANALQGEREKCLAAGMDDYLIKPARPETLYAMLERWLSAPLAAPETPLASSPSPPGGEILDQTIFGNLRTMDQATPGLLAQVIDLFLTNTPVLLETLQRQMQQQDLVQLARTAHSLKGSCASMGVQPMLDRCLELESAIRAEAIDRIIVLLDLLEVAFEQTCAVLAMERRSV